MTLQDMYEDVTRDAIAPAPLHPEWPGGLLVGALDGQVPCMYR